MLEDCLIDSRSSTRSRKPATLVLSILIHGTLAIALIVIPLFQVPLLTQVPLAAPLPPPVAGFRAVELVPVRGGPPPTNASPAVVASKPLVAPEVAPTQIAEIIDTAPAFFIGNNLTPGSGQGGPGGPMNGGGDPFSTRDIVVGPPPPPPVRPIPPPLPPPVLAPVRVANIDPSKVLFTVQPVYPRLAVLARVEGAVVLEAVITKDGLIDPKRLKVVSGHNMLWPAAVEAVEQWRYKPTVLNGERVEIVANITVNFFLNR